MKQNDMGTVVVIRMDPVNGFTFDSINKMKMNANDHYWFFHHSKKPQHPCPRCQNASSYGCPQFGQAVGSPGGGGILQPTCGKTLSQKKADVGTGINAYKMQHQFGRITKCAPKLNRGLLTLFDMTNMSPTKLGCSSTPFHKSINMYPLQKDS